MRVSAIIPFLALAGAVAASHSNTGTHGRHHSKRKSGHCPARLSRKPVSAAGVNPKVDSDAGSSSSVNSTPVVAAKEKATPTTSSSSSWSSPSSSSEWQESSSSSSSEWVDSSSSSEWQEPSSSSSSAQASETAKSSSKSSGESSPIGHSGAGLFSFKDDKCGASGATEDITQLTGPNGSQDFLNCGVDGAGWTPPYIPISQLAYVALDEILEDPNSPFKDCKPYLDTFNKYAGEFNLPPILIASIAMQESSCRPWLIGGDGSCGMMQLTSDKWPSDGSDCKDVDFNVRTGAKYFADRLKQFDGSFLLAAGQYNGWTPGMTHESATAVKGQCCRCQNNLSYMQELLNGWMQGVDGSQLGDFDFGC